MKHITFIFNTILISLLISSCHYEAAEPSGPDSIPPQCIQIDFNLSIEDCFSKKEIPEGLKADGFSVFENKSGIKSIVCEGDVYFFKEETSDKITALKIEGNNKGKITIHNDNGYGTLYILVSPLKNQKTDLNVSYFNSKNPDFLGNGCISVSKNEVVPIGLHGCSLSISVDNEDELLIYSIEGK